MKTNAFTQGRVRLFMVWGDADSPSSIELDPGTKVFVCWAPILKQWIASVTHIDYRYDAIVAVTDFMLDASMLPVDEPEPAGRYYLNRARTPNLGVA